MRKVILASLLGISCHIFAEEVAPEQHVRQVFESTLPGVEVTSVRAAPIQGFYQVMTADDRPLLISEDGRFILTGDIYEISAGKISNLSEKDRMVSRAELFKEPESELFVFKPEGEVKARIAVFTDIDCGYCRKLHAEIPRLNALGVQVNYFAYPRAGVDSPSYDKMVSAWCAENRNEALTKAKAGQAIAPKLCENPVKKQMGLGHLAGVTGTPAIVLESGELLPGYLPADELAKQLSIR
ncbi:MAG: thioredoxin fold domain-containing protein [Hahellaceae bacterium]|nr:thioredoxin fold domain-containing protein [Hahellaceae bacterium]